MEPPIERILNFSAGVKTLPRCLGLAGSVPAPAVCLPPSCHINIICLTRPFDHRKINTVRNKCVATLPPIPILVQGKKVNRSRSKMITDYVGSADTVREGSRFNSEGGCLK